MESSRIIGWSRGYTRKDVTSTYAGFANVLDAIEDAKNCLESFGVTHSWVRPVFQGGIFGQVIWEDFVDRTRCHMSDWKQRHANEADKAVRHHFVQDVIAEQLQNLRCEGDALARYGLTKIAHYAATVARAQALGFDPDLLTLTPEEGNRVLMERAAAAVSQASQLPSSRFERTRTRWTQSHK